MSIPLFVDVMNAEIRDSFTRENFWCMPFDRKVTYMIERLEREGLVADNLLRSYSNTLQSDSLDLTLQEWQKLNGDGFVSRCICRAFSGLAQPRKPRTSVDQGHETRTQVRILAPAILMARAYRVPYIDPEHAEDFFRRGWVKGFPHPDLLGCVGDVRKYIKSDANGLRAAEARATGRSFSTCLGPKISLTNDRLQWDVRFPGGGEKLFLMYLLNRVTPIEAGLLEETVAV